VPGGNRWFNHRWTRFWRWRRAAFTSGTPSIFRRTPACFGGDNVRADELGQTHFCKMDIFAKRE
jgi:hypothetical protein